MSFDWKSLISDNVDKNRLASNIRKIFELKYQDPPEVILTANDDDYIALACERAVQPQLAQLFQSINATEKLLTLIRNCIITMNSLAIALFDENQSKDLKFEPAIMKTLSSKLQLRYEFLKVDWPVDDENSNSLLDSICEKYSNSSSFRSLSYTKLNSDYLEKVSNNQKKILQNVWANGSDLRTKIQQYNLSLSIVDHLEARGIDQLENLTDDDVKILVKKDRTEMKEQLSNVKDNMADVSTISDAHNRFKENLSNLLKKETRSSKERETKREIDLKQRKQCTEEAIKCVEDIKKNLDKLSTDNKNELETKLKDVASKLNVNWQFTTDELNKPDQLLQTILTDLNKANENYNMSLCTAYQSDEDIIAHISGGIALYGIQLTDPKQLGEPAKRPLLSRPSNCELKSPSLSFESNQQKFTSFEASNQFTKTIKTSGFTVASYFKASGWGCHVEASHSQSSQHTSTSIHQKKTQSTIAIQADYTVVPIKCFRIPREEMKLSVEAENALANVNNMRKAKDFLRQFHSHVTDGIQHVGGIYMRTVTVETEDETDIESLEKIAATQMNASASAGGSYMGFSAGISVSVESIDINANKEGKEKIFREATITRKVDCIGPPCYNSDLFVKLLYSNNSSWYVIDRDELTSFIPIWEIILMRYSSQPDMIQAANLLKHVWLKEAQAYEHIPLIETEIKRIQSNDYISSGGTFPYSILINVDSKSSLEMLEVQIKQCLNCIDMYELSSSMFLNEVILVFQMISTRSNTCCEDFLAMLLERDTMKFFLQSLIRRSEDAKFRKILSILANVFSVEILQDLSKKQVELEPQILDAIEKYHKSAEEMDTFAATGTEIFSNGTHTLVVHNNDLSLSLRVKQRLVSTFFTVYPQLVVEFNKNAPDKIHLTIQPTLDYIPSKTKGVNITLSSNYFLQHPEDTDILTCEAMHIIQNYSGVDQPIWLVEGIRNYARYKYGTNNLAAGWFLPNYSSEQHYTNGHLVASRFLIWIKNRMNPSIIKELNLSLINGTYSDEIWMKQGGRVDQLWQLYAQDPNICLNKEIILNIPSLVVGGTYKLTNVGSGKVVDIYNSGTADGTNVGICRDTNNPAQRWTLHRHDDGTYKLINPNNRKALDVAGRKNGSNVQIYTDNDTAAQKWFIVLNDDDGSYKFINILERMALDVTGENVQIWIDNGTAAQKWRLTFIPNA